MIKEKVYISNELLSRHTTFRIGGPAKLWAEPDGIDELKAIIMDAGVRGMHYRVIGNGSNVLIDDKGVDGLVIKLSNLKKISVKADSIYADSGASLNELIRTAVLSNLSGLEFLAGIPGTIGGAVKTNAGAFGKEISSILKDITVLAKDGNIYNIPVNKIHFGYRSSDIKEDIIILGGSFFTAQGSYKEINKNIEDILSKRAEKFPAGVSSAGSIFKNPVGAAAGELIDRFELKGAMRGKAIVSPIHGNIIINTGTARAQDVKELITYIKGIVYKETGISLELEIEYW